MQMKPVHSPPAGLFHHSVILLAAAQIGNVATMLFQILMMRRLPVIEYGILASMLSLILVVGTPVEALRTAVAHQTALLTRAGEGGAIKSLLRQWSVRLAGVGLVMLLVGLMGANRWATMFQLPAPAPIQLTALIMAGSLFMPLFMGVLQGTQSFVWMSIHGQVWAVTRLLMAVCLLFFWGATAISGLWAQMLGVVASIGVGIILVLLVLKAHCKPIRRPFEGSGYFMWSLAVLTGFAVIMNADVALVKKYFSPEEAGMFARAATIGRSIVFFPLPIAFAMFPKVVSKGVTSKEDQHILMKAIGFTAALIALAGIACSLAMRPIWQLFTGEVPTSETIVLARWLIGAMAPLGLTFLLVNFELAQQRFRAPLGLIVLAVLYIGGVHRWHHSLAQVISVLGVISMSSLLLITWDMLNIFRPKGRPR